MPHIMQASRYFPVFFRKLSTSVSLSPHKDSFTSFLRIQSISTIRNIITVSRISFIVASPVGTGLSSADR